MPIYFCADPKENYVAAAVSCREGHVNARRAFCPEFAPHPAVHVATERQDTGVATKANSEADFHFISCEYLWDKGSPRQREILCPFFMCEAGTPIENFEFVIA